MGGMLDAGVWTANQHYKNNDDDGEMANESLPLSSS